MRLLEKQFIFHRNIVILETWLLNNGYQWKCGESLRTKYQAIEYARLGVGIINSQHRKYLAKDYIVFKNGVQLTLMEYEPIGRYWQMLHPDNRFGGDWDGDGKFFESGEWDGQHFEMQG